MSSQKALVQKLKKVCYELNKSAKKLEEDTQKVKKDLAAAFGENRIILENIARLEKYRDDLDKNKSLYILAQAGKTKKFDALALEMKEDFINSASPENQKTLRRIQRGIDKELSQCKTAEERAMVFTALVKAVKDYRRSINDGTAPVCAKFPIMF